MTVFEPITSQHFETTLSQNNVFSNAIKRDHWLAIICVVYLVPIVCTRALLGVTAQVHPACLSRFDEDVVPSDSGVGVGFLAPFSQP